MCPAWGAWGAAPARARAPRGHQTRGNHPAALQLEPGTPETHIGAAMAAQSLPSWALLLLPTVGCCHVQPRAHGACPGMPTKSHPHQLLLCCPARAASSSSSSAAPSPGWGQGGGRGPVQARRARPAESVTMFVEPIPKGHKGFPGENCSRRGSWPIGPTLALRDHGLEDRPSARSQGPHC